MKAILQSCRECLDRLDGMIDCVHKETLKTEIIEVRARFTELLASCQSHAQVTIGDPGGLDSSVDIFPIGNDEPQTIMPVALDNLDTIPLSTPLDRSLLLQPLALCGQFSDNEYGPSLGLVGVAGSLPEPGGQLSQGLLLCDTSGLVSHEDGAQPVITQHDTYSEGRTSSGCSARCGQPFPLPIMQSNQGKVKCTWPGCTRFVKNGSLARHLNEIHRRKIKAVCASCGKGFTRLYLQKSHVCPADM